MSSRRTFIKTSALAGAGLMTAGPLFGNYKDSVEKGLRVGVIGLDTSHSIAFAKSLNKEDALPEFGGYKVVAAYPHGSTKIQSSMERIPEYTKEFRQMGVEIVDSIKGLLKKTDVILLETNDGNPHLEQALQVFKSGKTVFIDKPVAGSLTDAFAIYQAAADYKVPVFSASSLRYISNMDDILKDGSIGKVLGAEAYTPCYLEPSHPDLFWYGVHGVEPLITVMGTGCKTVSRTQTKDTDFVVGVWNDGRIGTFRGLRSGKRDHGGFVFGEKDIKPLGTYNGYDPLLKEIIKFFQTGKSSVTPEETLEIFTFMEAADESKRRGGAVVSLEETKQKAIEKIKKSW